MTRPHLPAMLAALALLIIWNSSALAAPATPSPTPSATASADVSSPSAEQSSTLDTADAPDEAASPVPTDDQNILIQLGDEGDNVILLQMRLQDLGYYNYKITGFFGDFTKDAVADFQKTNGIDSDGIAGAKTLEVLYSNDAKRKPVEPIVIKPTTTVKKPSSVKKGVIMNWSVANQKWKIGMKYKVIDFDTGISYYMIRCNQSYTVGHADVAPATKADTSKLKKAFDGSLTAYRRAQLVNIGGTWIAASIYAEPHGSTGVPGNGLNLPDKLQQVCIHFRNSWTNGRGLVDSAHQYQIMRAAGKTPTMARTALVYPGD